MGERRMPCFLYEPSPRRQAITGKISIPHLPSGTWLRQSRALGEARPEPAALIPQKTLGILLHHYHVLQGILL